MVHKTVLKVDISEERWKKKILKAVSGIPGVDIVEADVAKGTLTVTGAADPYEVIRQTRKTGKCVDVVSIGPLPAPPKPAEPKKAEEKKPQPEKKPPPAEKKPDEKKPDQKAPPQAPPQQLALQVVPQPQPQQQPCFPSPYMGHHYPPPYMGQSYPTSERVAVVYIGRQNEPNPACNIM